MATTSRRTTKNKKSEPDFERSKKTLIIMLIVIMIPITIMIFKVTSPDYDDDPNEPQVSYDTIMKE